MHIVLFFLPIENPVLSFSLDCQFLIANSVFSNVYWNLFISWIIHIHLCICLYLCIPIRVTESHSSSRMRVWTWVNCHCHSLRSALNFGNRKATVVLLVLFLRRSETFLLAVITRFKTKLFSLSTALWYFRLWSYDAVIVNLSFTFHEISFKSI